MEPTQQLEVILPTITDLVDRLEPAELGNSTPCEKFQVVDVLDHMITLGGAFAYMFRGEVVPEINSPARNGAVPSAEFRKSMDDLLDAVRSDGALERVIDSPVGTMPGETFARLVAFDGLVHGWDIASGGNLTYTVPADVVQAVDSFARSAITADMRDGDTFAGPTTPPAGASALEELVAFSGRDV